MRFLSLLFLLLPFSASAVKKDYLKLRDSLLLQSSCGWPDSVILAEQKKNLGNLDTNSISRNLDQYYYDLGMLYYKLGAHDTKGKFWQLALNNFEKSAAKNPTAYGLWQCTFCAYFSGDCRVGAIYLERYVKLESRKKLRLRAEQIKGMQDECK